MLEADGPLLEDFPEVVLPIKNLENAPIRANYQEYKGQPTKILFSAKGIRFASTEIADERGNSGAVIRGGGMTASLRGMVETLPTGEQIRPDLILIDDPQTRQSAGSPSQVQTREDILNGDLAGMAGVGQKMSILCAMTVVEQDDLACRLLDRDRSPDWVAIKAPMLESFPKNMDLWDQYNTLRVQEAVFEVEEGSCNEFYEANREALEEGAVHYWPDRIDNGKITALQSAMDAYYKSPRAFAAEYQNDPDSDTSGDLEPLRAGDLVKRQTHYTRGQVPDEATHLTAFIDVQRSCLFWMVCSWAPGFRGQIIDYGMFPEQTNRMHTTAKIRKPLQKWSKDNDDEGAIQAGISYLVQHLIERDFYKHDGTLMKIDRGFVDSRYKTDKAENALIETGTQVFTMSYGIGIGAKNESMSRWVKKKGAHHGHHWVVQKPEKRKLRACFIDTNYWKSQAYEGLKVAKEHHSAITFYKTQNFSHHQAAADHLCSEVAVRVEAKGKIVDEWQLPSHAPDNHLFDCLVGNLAAASTLGITKATDNVIQRKPRKKRGRSSFKA